jgi:hypothetical protein
MSGKQRSAAVHTTMLDRSWEHPKTHRAAILRSAFAKGASLNRDLSRVNLNCATINLVKPLKAYVEDGGLVPCRVRSSPCTRTWTAPAQSDISQSGKQQHAIKKEVNCFGNGHLERQYRSGRTYLRLRNRR